MAKILGIGHPSYENNPIETWHETLDEVRTEIIRNIAIHEGSMVFLFGDSGSYFQDDPYPVNRMFVHEVGVEIIRFFDAFAETTMPRDIEGNFNSYYYLFMSKSYEEAFDLARDIALTSSTDFCL